MRIQSLILCGLLSLTTTVHADEPIGMGLNVATEGFLGTTVSKVTVAKIDAGSQAERKGLLVGDEVLKVNGVTVPGAGVFTLRPHMKFEPGVSKRLSMKHVDGTAYEVELVKAAPSEPRK